MIINVPQTKILTFGRGRPGQATAYTLNDEVVERNHSVTQIGVITNSVNLDFGGGAKFWVRFSPISVPIRAAYYHDHQK